jgi:hypothetical protein
MSKQRADDPSLHRERERRMIEHVERLLGDDRLRIDTKRGRRSVTSARRDIKKEDREVDLKRTMAQLGVYDRDLQAKLPVGRELSVTLSNTRFWFFRSIVGQMKVLCLAPWEDLIEGKPTPRPVSYNEVKDALARMHSLHGVPQTVVLLSTSGFTREAKDLVGRSGDRAVLLVEPDEAGGYTVHAPPDLEGLAQVLDPEEDEDKIERIRAAIENCKADLLSSGLPAQRLADRTKLPLAMVEEELKSYARETGMAARKLDGGLVLFREGGVAQSAAAAGGADMPFLQRMKNLFSRKGDNEKKLALLAERRAALSVQRDKSYEEMGVLEQREAEMREQFKNASGEITKKRVTTQLVQLRKDLERRQQLLGMLNQQINVVSTHLHNLELVQQGQGAQLPSSEDIATDAAAAEEVLAELQASSELAGSLGTTSPTGLSDEEQALYDELQAEITASKEKPAVEPTAKTPAVATPREREKVHIHEPPTPTSTERSRSRGEAEAG